MAKSALKFKDSVAAYEKLAQEIAARRFAPVYLLMLSLIHIYTGK